MGFKRIAVETPAEPVAPPQRVRAPVVPVVEAPPSPPPTIATYCVDIHISETRQLYEFARALLKSDGMAGSDILETLKSNGVVDIGTCLKVSLRRVEETISHHLGLKHDAPNVYLEIPDAVEPIAD
jgi:hypothetical protein